MKGAAAARRNEFLRLRVADVRESDMISEMQIHTIARQMIEKHGFEAIAEAARNAQACESKGEADEAKEWRHIEDAMKMMRGPHQKADGFRPTCYELDAATEAGCLTVDARQRTKA